LAGIPAEAVVGPVLVAIGARAGLTVQQLDELELAAELLLRGCAGREVTVEIGRVDGEVRVSVMPVAERWAARRSALLGELAGRIELRGERAELRAGR
jgi:hypothetical protein